jgi:hypothetical protein
MKESEAKFTQSRRSGDWKFFRQSCEVLKKMNRDIDDITFEPGQVVEMDDPVADFEQQRQDAAKGIGFGLRALDVLLLPECQEFPNGGSLLKGDMTILMSPTNIGKCHGKGTELLDFSGRIVKVEDVRVGDLLMGPDGKPRKVLSTTQGRGPLYEITPKTGGDPWVCNDAHVLSLMCAFDREPGTGKRKRYVPSSRNGESCLWKGDVVNIPLNEYLHKSKNWRRRMKLWRAALDFQPRDLPVPPYVLGIWLGGGHSDRAALTTADDELANVWENWIRGLGHNLSVCGVGEASVYNAIGAGGAREALKNLGVLNNKHIPHEYLTSSRQQRLQLLAGIIDTDGCCLDRCFEVIQKSRETTDGIAYLARSLGFKVKVTETTGQDQNGTKGLYHRITIGGKLSEIPTLLARKRGRDGLKSPTTSGFRVRPIGDGDYYGFTLDGDHLYLLSDFTVTHNTTAMVTVAAWNILQGHDVLLVTHEGRTNDIKLKIWQAITGLTRQTVLQHLSNDDILRGLALARELVNRHLEFLPLVGAGKTVEEVLAAIRRRNERWRSVHGRGFDLLVDDYAAKLTTQMAGGGGWQPRQIHEWVYNQFTQLGLQEGFHVLTAIQTNREGSKANKRFGRTEARLLVMEDVQEAWGPMTTATNVITVNRDPIAQANGFLTFLICKSRSSEVNWAVCVKSNFACARSHWGTYDCTWYRGTDSMSDKMDTLLTGYRGQEVPAVDLIRIEKEQQNTV